MTCQAAVKRPDLRQSKREAERRGHPEFFAVESVARALCALSGADYDAKHVKRKHWRGQAMALVKVASEDVAVTWAGWVTSRLGGRR